MAKLDDFGRPIYESAEEYNKAKQTSANKSFQNKGVPDKRVTYKKQKSPLVWIGIFFFALGILSIVVNVYDDIRTPDFVVNNQPEKEVYLLPEGFETFTYNGQIYTLPTSYDEIVKTGLVIEEYGLEDMVSGQYMATLDLIDADGIGIMRGRISVVNPNDFEIPFGKCTVNYLYLQNPASYGAYFEFGNGFTFDSTIEDLEAYFGEPTSITHGYYDENTRHDEYEWAYKDEDETHSVKIQFVNGKIRNVSIEKTIIENE